MLNNLVARFDCKVVNNLGHFYIYEQDRFHAHRDEHKTC